MARSPMILSPAFLSLTLSLALAQAATLKAAGGAKPKAAPPAEPQEAPNPPLSRAEEVGAVVDDWQDAASKRDEIRYFKYFAPGAVVLGPDPAERWLLERFRRFAHARFVKGTFWANVTKARKISFSPDGKVAWFDEELESPSLGKARGSGVLVRYRGGWRIVQYNLSLPVPNDLQPKVVELIKGPAPATAAPVPAPKQP